MHFVGNVQIEIAIKSFHTICNNDNNKNKLHLEISLNCQLPDNCRVGSRILDGEV